MKDLEVLKKMINLYESTGAIESAKIPPALTPEKLFGMSAEERNQKFIYIFNKYKAEVDEM